MSAAPQALSHHEIIALVAPFARAGPHVDLAASDRLQRRLLFQPIEHAAVDGGLPALRESLLLEQPSTGGYRLARTLTLAEGLQSTLVGEGDDAAALLAAVQAVPATRQLQRIAGHWVAFSHRVATATGALQLAGASTRLAGLSLQMEVSRVQGIAAELTLAAASGVEYTLPEDLLAVLGLPWSRLSRAAGQWRASLAASRQRAKAHPGCRAQVRAQRRAPGAARWPKPRRDSTSVSCANAGRWRCAAPRRWRSLSA